MMHELDHRLWEELTLEEGEWRFAALTGVTPAFGGKHPGAGTHNSLLSLGRDVYLEVIALDPSQQPAPELDTSAFKPRLFAFAVRAENLATVSQLASRGGLRVSEAHHVSRESPGGKTLTWRSISTEGHGFGSFAPFFTAFEGKVHPAETAPKGCVLLEFSVGHPDHRALRHLYRLLAGKRERFRVPCSPSARRRGNT